MLALLIEKYFLLDIILMWDIIIEWIQ